MKRGDRLLAGRRRLLVGSLAAISVPAGHPALGSGSGRVALVIGSGAYRTVPALTNPARDARAAAQSFARLGFRTELLVDVERDALLQAIGRLAGAATGAEAAVFYYAGHAVEVAGRNLLLGLGVDVRSGVNPLERDSIAFDTVTGALQGRARTTLLFLDACRNSPFPARAAGAAPAPAGRTGTRSVGGGLASVSSGAGMLIVFATAPGQVALDGDGENSPFTAALLRHIEAPALEVRQMLGQVRQAVRMATANQQVPWDNSSLETAFCFRPPVADPAFARTIQAAVARAIPLPRDLQTRAFRRTAGGGGRFVGSWGGDGRWGGRGRQIILLVLSIDDPAGTADVILAFGPPTAGSAGSGPARWLRAIGRLEGVALEVDDPRTGWRFVFHAASDDELEGTAIAPDGERPRIRIRRIE